MSNVTKHPADLPTEFLCKTLIKYRELTSKSSFDEMYQSMLEEEVEHRKQFPFNAREIEQYLPS